MKNLSTYIIPCVLLLLTGCTKDDPLTVDQEDKMGESLTEIVSIQHSNITTDTVWVTMDPLEMSFTTPVTHLDLGNTFENVKDSLQFELDLPTSLSIDQPLALPAIHISEPYVLFNTAKDSLRVDEFPFRIGFRPAQRATSQERYEGLIENIKIRRKYQRIYYSGDVRIVLLDAQGNTHMEAGKFTGSKMGGMHTDVEVW